MIYDMYIRLSGCYCWDVGDACITLEFLLKCFTIPTNALFFSLPSLKKSRVFPFYSLNCFKLHYLHQLVN